MPGRGRPAILWAEDDPDDRTLVRAALSELKSPPVVEFAEDGTIVLERLGKMKTKPRLVVLDLKMPRMGGVETLRNLRRDPATKDVPVMVFSSGGLPEEAQQCRALGCIDVLRKPIEYNAFADAVARIIEHAGD